jgi:DNA repair protein RadC
MEESQEQLEFFQEETAATRKRTCAGIPIYKVTLVREGKLPCYDQRIRSAAIASTILHNYLDGVDREHFVVLLLDQKNQVIGIHTVSVGSLTASIVHPREVYKVAILKRTPSSRQKRVIIKIDCYTD